jgi:mannose-6-phosphate isomerase
VSRQAVAIHGVLRHYDWGVIDGLTRWSGVATGTPQAELWYGGHPTAPSPTIADPGITLADAWPGEPAPLLTKILAAQTPLSLQVHPAAGQIEQWLGDPVSSALLSDRAEKTEMLIALEPFTVLLGWRDLAVATRVLRAAGAAPAVVAALDAGDRLSAIRLLLTQHPLRRQPADWVSAAQAAGLDELAVGVFDAVGRQFGADPGIAVGALLHSDRLDVGDAAYVPAGVPHAYVHGLGVEVMNSSDNVLRLGLTTKTMSVEHALAALNTPATPELIRCPADAWYRPANAPFVALMMAGGEHVVGSGSYRLVLCLSGETVVAYGDEHCRIARGEAVALLRTCPPARILPSGSAVVVWATVAAGEVRDEH